ncbi:GDP-mannose 4,6-dehydratase, partial [bacterium]|nr:GDP-mannose 4,6-dehydratase [bacterium]
ELTVFGDGSQTRSFCFVDDLVEGICRLLESDEHFPVNLGNPDEVSILDVAREVITLTGSASSLRFTPLPENYSDDPKTRRPDITRARGLLGWEPRIDRAEGLRRTHDYFRSRVTTAAKHEQ